jgi:L-rhamnose mutarotase
MERVCFVGRVRTERLEEYRERHERVWLEMLAALRDAGWGNYSLFLTDDGLLVGYLETDDYQAALARWPGRISTSAGRPRWRPISPN